ncbi:MAG: type III pantothenate kinase [Thiobacillus sp.]|nr:type III pantothenate kinase [Thiobacillus sp.]
MSASHLLIDAGNTRLKWVVVVDGLWQSHGSSEYGDLLALSQALSAGTTCTIASVARTEHEDQIKTLLGTNEIEPRWLTAEAQFLDVRNTYANPKQLGADRWMGLIAARQRTHAATLVVSMGTAMTVDALSVDGVFLGGLIVPGRAMMQQSLQLGTAHVAAIEGAWQAFPQTTADAVHSGIVAAMCGAIHMQLARLAKQSDTLPQCLVTGGDAATLLPHLDLPVEHVPFLVLEGIDRVVREDLDG